MSANEAGDGAAEASAMTNGVSANESALSPAPSPPPAPAPAPAPATSSPPPTAPQQQQPPTAMDDGNVTAQISSAAQFEGGASQNGAVKQFNEASGNNNKTNYTKSNGYHNSANNHYNNNNSSSNHFDNTDSPLKSPHQQQQRGVGRETSFHPIQQHHLRQAEDSDNEDYELQGAAGGLSGGPIGDYWQQRNGIVGAPASGRQSRALSPTYIDNMSENSEQPPVVPLVRSKSRPELSSNAHMNSAMSAASRYNNLSYWKARRVVFYRNGDPFFPGVELRYRPGRDITSLDSLLDKISPKMDLPRGARYVFSMDGDRKYHLDELEDGASYVVSSFKAFKVSTKTFLCVCVCVKWCFKYCFVWHMWLHVDLAVFLL